MTWKEVGGMAQGRDFIIAIYEGKNSSLYTSNCGSSSAILHEACHCYDYNMNNISHSKRFIKYREKDINELGSYFKQSGYLGIEETFAEYMSLYYINKYKLKQVCPNLFQYFDKKYHVK